MPEQYDAESGVTELDTRDIILDAFRRGWVPAREGELSVKLDIEGGVAHRALKLLPRAGLRSALASAAGKCNRASARLIRVALRGVGVRNTV